MSHTTPSLKANDRARGSRGLEKRTRNASSASFRYVSHFRASHFRRSRSSETQRRGAPANWERSLQLLRRCVSLFLDRPTWRGACAILVCLIAFASSNLVAQETAPESAKTDAAKLEFFEKKVRPILVNNCNTCHSAETNSKGGLRVDDRNGLITGGGRGAAVVPNDPAKSLLIAVVSHVDGKPKMPPEGKLEPQQIEDLKTWIAEGALWTPVEIPADLGHYGEEYEKLRKNHWAWQPLTKPVVPSVSDNTLAPTEVDRFIVAKLQEKSLPQVGLTDKDSLLRRVAFDLTGLPPTPKEIAAFKADESPKALETAVDRLLASSAFGEHWGRHWLDVARYGESTGSARNLPYPHAWRYRDYVIESFNADKPFNQFLREQVAGDLLPASSIPEKTQQLVATAFLAIGVKDVNQRFKVRYIMDNVDEQIDTVSRAVLGLTVSCARCHDHKFDPIPTTDYYALAGIFRSSDNCSALRNKMGGGGLDYYEPNLLISLGGGNSEDAAALAAKIEVAQKAYEKAKGEFDAIFGTPEGKEIQPNGRPKQFQFRQKMNRAQQELSALTDPAAKGDVAMGVRDSKEIADTEIRIRGEAEKLGPVVPRGFLSLYEVPGVAKVNPQQSGRLELAQWLTSDKNPLTVRVAANRVWAHLMGKGIVQTVDNFGTTGDKPSHPELLDHLANRLVEHQWSIKKLIKEVVLTRTYQLASDRLDAAQQIDPENRYLWRHRPRRLTAEEIRDSMLATTSTLDVKRPVASPAKELKVIELRNNGPEAKRFQDFANQSKNRSVYLPLLRGITPRPLEVFDFAEQGMVTGGRDSTTVAPQALFLLNDAFVRRNSLALADLLLGENLPSEERLAKAYRLVLGREPNGPEIIRAQAYLAQFGPEEFAQLTSRSVTEAKAPPTAVAQADIAAAAAQGGTQAGGAQAVAIPNPDDPVPGDDAVKEEVVTPKSVEAAALASFIQALFGSAEFRYLR